MPAVQDVFPIKAKIKQIPSFITYAVDCNFGHKAGGIAVFYAA